MTNVEKIEYLTKKGWKCLGGDRWIRPGSFIDMSDGVKHCNAETAMALQELFDEWENDKASSSDEADLNEKAPENKS